MKIKLKGKYNGKNHSPQGTPCSSGIIFLPVEETEEVSWFWARIALLVCLVLSTVAGLWLFISARREIKKLERLGAEMRLEEVRAQRERAPRRHRG